MSSLKVMASSREDVNDANHPLPNCQYANYRIGNHHGPG
jgi:hypothetical protein